MSDLSHTPLYEAHRALGARLVEFGGFEMPVQYTSILKEHEAVRERAGLFDVSHMGQIELTGTDVVESLERLLTCRVETLEPGRVRYGLLCHEAGGVVDDVTVYRADPAAFMLCVNASNVARVDGWLRDNARPGTQIDNASERTAMLALQGPASPAILDAIGIEQAKRLGRFQFGAFESLAGSLRISSTGYTGAPGFELYLPADRVQELFDALLVAGRQRFRPILLTSITTMLGISPLTFWASGQARFLQPMAITMFFGLFFSTFLILLVVPCAYAVLEDLVHLLAAPRATVRALLRGEVVHDRPEERADGEGPGLQGSSSALSSEP